MNNQEKKQSGCFLKSCFALTGGIFGVIAILFFVPILVEIFLWSVGGFLIVADPIISVDTVVVLSGGEDDSRLEEAAKLYNDGNADWVILTETGETIPERNLLYSQIKRDELIQLGVPGESIIITEKVVSSTWGEARVVMKLMLHKGMESGIIVTDPYHTRRTRIVFRDVFLPRDLEVRVRPVVGHWYRSPTWWTSQRGWDVTILEYSKLFGYIMGFKED